MPRTPFVAALLAIAVLPLALAAPPPATTGPYAGTVREGETDVHAYDNNPSGNPCVDLATTYTVALSYAPASDVLVLAVGSSTATGANGAAAVTFQAGACAAFDVAVTGQRVADEAAYVVTVTRGALAGIASVEWG